MGEERWIWVGGEAGPVAPEAARIAATDQAYLYGTGLYETLRTYHAKPFALPQHMDRLARGAERMGFGPLPAAAMARALEELASRRAPEESYLRLTVSPGIQFPGWNTPLQGPPRWVAYAGPLAPHVAAVYERGVSCIVGSRPRWNPGGFVPAVKLSANPEMRLAWLEVTRRGAYEAFLLNGEGLLAEGSSSNVFLVKDRVVVTPHLESGILDGVTRSVLLQLCGEAGLRTEERAVRPGEIWEAEEAFLASTLKEVVPVVQVEDRAIGTGEPGVITDRLLGLLQEYALETTRA